MGGLISFIRTWIAKLGEWIKPDPADNLPLQVVRLLFKSIALLIMIALSPVLLIVMVFVFFAAV